MSHSTRPHSPPANQAADQALLSLCHWRLTQNAAFLDDPAQLALSDDEAQALFDSLAPFFADVGLSLHLHSPTCWTVQGELIQEMDLASLQQAIGQDLSLQLAQQQPLQKLQSEVQMLLYNHPVNALREAKGAICVNAFWVHREPAPASIWQKIRSLFSRPSRQEHS